MKIKKGDIVVVISGKDKGKSGEVLRALPSENKVLVKGVGIVKKHTKVTKKGDAGVIVEVERPIHVSNVMYKDTKTGKGTRIGIVRNGASRQRLLKKSGEKIA